MNRYRTGKKGASVADGVDRRFAARRDRRGRFLKGASGNPLGRPPGIMNQATRDAAVLLGGEAGALTKKAIELALAGDIAALRLCIDRIIAPQREQPIAFAMPPIDKAGDLAAAATALTVAAAQGAMTPAEAASLAQVLEAHARISEVTARMEAERLAARQKEVGARCDLRVCVVMAHRLREGFAEEERDGEVAARPIIPSRCVATAQTHRRERGVDWPDADQTGAFLRSPAAFPLSRDTSRSSRPDRLPTLADTVNHLPRCP